MKEIEIKVKGMVCNGCENRIQNVLKAVDGIIDVNADHEKGTVSVKTNSEIDMNIIYEKLDDLGFEVEKKDKE